MSNAVNIISKTSIINANIKSVELQPTINEAIGIRTEIIMKVYDLYNQLNGNKCAPKIIAITISIFSGTVG